VTAEQTKTLSRSRTATETYRTVLVAPPPGGESLMKWRWRDVEENNSGTTPPQRVHEVKVKRKSYLRLYRPFRVRKMIWGWWWRYFLSSRINQVQRRLVA